MDGLRSAYSEDWPDLYIYSQKKILKILGHSKSFAVNSRFYWAYQIVKAYRKDYKTTNITTNETDFEKGAFNAIKRNLSEENFKDLLRLKLDRLSEDKLQGSFSVVESFYETPDTELPPLKGNLVSLLNLIGINFYEEYEENRKQKETQSEIEFFESIQSCNPAKAIWNSIIEDAKKDKKIMQELKKFIKDTFPNTQDNINALLS